MNMLQVIFVLLCMQAFSKVQAQTAWSEFENKDLLVLKKDLKVNPNFTLLGDSSFIVHQIETLDPVPVEVFTLQFTHCSSTTDQIPIEMTILDSTYGFEWKKSCQAIFYVEFKDLSKKSYFEKASR